jgi:hypothetical protein
MNKVSRLMRAEIGAARRKWGGVGAQKMKELRALVGHHKLSVVLGDVLLLDDHWYVTHSGLLRCARRRHCSGIDTVLEHSLSDPIANRWVFRATVYAANKSNSFVGYGDADPSNVSNRVRGAEMRVAETRAVNRALRKAYGIGLCSVEELGSLSSPPAVRDESSAASIPPTLNGYGRTQPRLRDQLCLVIRQFKLDPNLVKRYAADFCGTEAISDASRESVETFISYLKKTAEENREALICKLNSYSVRVEAET